MKATERHKTCLKCGKEYYCHPGVGTGAWGKRKYCSVGCKKKSMVGNIPWNKGIKSWVKPWFGKKRPDMQNDKHHNWKGEKVGYRAIHIWVSNRLGKAQICSKCGEYEKKVHWANVDHKYRRDIDDYVNLCTKCHYRFDKERGLR